LCYFTLLSLSNDMAKFEDKGLKIVYKVGDYMLLSKAKIGQKGEIIKVEGKEKTKKFLFSLGCSEGEEITLISILAGNYVVNIKDSRFAIDEAMAKAIVLAD